MAEWLGALTALAEDQGLGSQHPHSVIQLPLVAGDPVP